MDLVNSLEISGDGLKLNAEAAITGDGEAILSDHGHQSASIVLKDLQNQHSQISIGLLRSEQNRVSDNHQNMNMKERK